MAGTDRPCVRRFRISAFSASVAVRPLLAALRRPISRCDHLPEPKMAVIDFIEQFYKAGRSVGEVGENALSIILATHHHHQHRHEYADTREGNIIKMDFHLLHLPGQPHEPPAGDAADWPVRFVVRCGCGPGKRSSSRNVGVISKHQPRKSFGPCPSVCRLPLRPRVM